jgi:hypothetical protein
MRLLPTSAHVLGALLIAACSGGGGEWAGTVTDSSGVTIVSNTNRGIWTAATQWTVEEDLRVGALEGDPNYQFGQIGFVAVGSDGRMFVLDAQAQQVRVFSAQGDYELSFGGPGAGPGELGPGALFVLRSAGDTILVPDLANRRINRYAPNGSSIGSSPLELEKGLPMVYRSTTSGTVAQQIRPLALPDLPATDSMDAIVLLASDGSVTDTLIKFPTGGTISLGGSSPEINLYSPEPSWDIRDDLKVLYGRNEAYRIGLYSAGGQLERIVTKPFERMPVTDRDKQAVMGSLEKLWSQAGVPPAVIPRLRALVNFGEFLPAFANIQAGPQGTTWIQHVQRASDLSDEQLENYNIIEESGAPDWDVFDSQGRLLGIVTMPDRFAPRVFSGDRIYGVWRDELGVQYLMRLRINGM